MHILLIENDQVVADSLADALREDGHVVDWREANSAPIQATNQQYDLVIGDLTEIGIPEVLRTALKHARQRAENAERALAQAEHLAKARGRLAAHLSHELKTPIAAIQATAQTMLKCERTSDKYKQALHLCERNSRGMGQLIRRMLDLAKAGSDTWQPDIQPVNPRNLLTTAIDLHAPLAQDDGVELLLVCRDRQEIQTDADLLLIMVNNLLGNAIRYTPRGKAAILRFSPANAERGPTISVIDTGPGIRPEARPHIFDAFYQDESTPSRMCTGNPNYGLGLALTAELAERLNIQIEVDSNPGEGAAFHLIFPLRNGND